MTVQETPNTIRINIDKPLYGSYVAIRDIYLKKGKLLIVKAKKLEGDKYEYECRVTPKEWLKTAVKKPEIHLIPDKPMIMYYNHVTRFVKKREEIENVSILDNTEGQKAFLKAYENLKKGAGHI